MERQRGKGLRNRDVVNEDKISELPDDLLMRILSSIPTETAIATSVLSKRWKSLWKMMPNLKFNSKYHHRKFAMNVCNSLILYKAPVLESLDLAVGYKCVPLHIEAWIAIAFSRKVRKLVIKLEVEDIEVPGLFYLLEEVISPGIVLRRNNTLEILKLTGSILFDLTSPVCLNFLRELHLYHVRFKNEESVSNLLCGCPRLQDLVVHQEDFVGMDTFTIVVPSLQRLTLALNRYTKGLVINAPSLKYLNINIFNALKFCLIENAPKLVEAKITQVSDTMNIMNENILRSLVLAKRLSLRLSPLTIKYPTGKIFHQLLSLELYTTEEEWWNLLSLMLDSAPKLQILKLFCYRRRNRHNEDCSKWNKPKCVPECLLFHLETFVWTRYMWEREDEKEVATYILKNSRLLKKATLSTIRPIRLEKVEKRREMLNELANEVRASNSCHLVFESDTYLHRTKKDADLDEYV